MEKTPFGENTEDELGSVFDDQTMKANDKVITTIYCLIFIIGLVCNVSVIVAMLMNYSSMVTGSHIYALHMAIADLMLICTLPFQIIEISSNETWRIGLGICKIYRTIKVMNFLASIQFLTLMAVDRYRALSRNYRPSSRKGPPKIAHAIAGLVWLCAFSFSMPVFMRATIIGDGEATHCFEQWDDYQYLDPYDESYFQKNPGMQNICKSVHLDFNDTSMSDDELADLFGLNDYPDYKNDSVQSKEMFDIEVEPKVDIHIDPFLFSDDERSKRSTSAVAALNMGDFSGEVEDWMYNKEECKTLECRRVFDNDTVYDNLKADKQLVDYCHKDHHDCGQSNQCPNDTINPCICPISNSHRKYQIVTFVFFFIVPVMIIIYCYTRFLIQICTISQSINTYGKLSMSANHQAEIRRLAILVMGLIIAFLICWTPVELIALIHFTGKAGMLCENACRTAKNVSRTLVWLSSCINSMLYLCMGGFKKRLKESMKQKLARVSKSEAENRNSTIPTARETLLDNTVTNGSRANSLSLINGSTKYLTAEN